MIRQTVPMALLAFVLAPGCAQTPSPVAPAAAMPATAAPGPATATQGVAGAAAQEGTASPRTKRASTCLFPTFRANQFGGAVTLTVSNDGSCGRNLTRQGQSGGRYGSGFAVYSGGRVTVPAQHGQAEVTLLPDQRLRVAYTPNPGYIGIDGFEYVPQPGNVTITVTVNVVAPGAS